MVACLSFYALYLWLKEDFSAYYVNIFHFQKPVVKNSCHILKRAFMCLYTVMNVSTIIRKQLNFL